MPDYSKICFVIMPFGVKKVGDREVDFDRIYHDIFVPAISNVGLPEGGLLEPRRTDQDFFTGDIGLEMFHYLEYSRFAVADISGLNANVFYELGARHRVREAGTAIFHQAASPIPFDIKSIKAFPYEYEPEAKAEEARALITRVLTESLVQNRIDSPIRIALNAQQQSGQLQGLLQAAENAVRHEDWNGAIRIYRDAIAIDARNPLLRMKLGILLKDRDNWDDAHAQFEQAVAAAPTYAEAWRELGIAQNKIAWVKHKGGGPRPPSSPTPGEEAFLRAIELQNDDFDALAALGGALKRAERHRDARDYYRRSREVSNGHPYPLLNEIKLRAFLDGQLMLEGADRRALIRAERFRSLQVAQNPPYDKPWCFFDLAEIRLYQGRVDDFVSLIEQAFPHCEATWQPQTFLDSLRLLEPAAASLPGLERGIRVLEDYLG